MKSWLASYLLVCRQQARLTQRSLAEAIGCSHEFVCDVEKGRRVPGVVLLDAWADRLAISRDYLRYLIGRFPEDVVSGRKLYESEFDAAMKRFRTAASVAA
jgi:transcriptional regulator with XRE-family HTH domain